MKRLAVLVLVATSVSACGGGSIDTDTTDTGSGTAQNLEDKPSGDGTKLLIAGVGGVDVVDLDAESQDPFIEDLGQVHSLRLIGDTLWFVEGTDLIAADARSGDLAGRVSIADGVAGLSVGGSTAWVLTGIPGASSAVAVVDRDDMALLGTIPAPESTSYLFLAALGDDAWAFGGDIESSTTVSKLDLDSMSQTTTADIGIIADSMIGGEGAIWVGGTIPAFLSSSGNPGSGIAKVDPGTGEVVLTIDLGEPADHIAVRTGFGHLWATAGLEGTLHKIDPATGEIVDSVETGAGAAGVPLEILFTREHIWVFNTSADTLTAYDPESLELETGIDVPPLSAAPVFAP